MKEIGQKFSHWLFCGFMSGVFPVLFFLIGWWGSIGRVAEDKIFLVAFAGMLWGILLNYLVLKRILSHLYSLPLWLMSIIYIFYAICIYGFFMGFPLFNVFLGIPAGLYMGIRFQGKQKNTVRLEKIVTSIFTCLVLFVLCTTTAILALGEKTLGSQLQSMFNLPFMVTRPTIISIILIGGIGLVAGQYFLTGYYFTKANTQN